MRRHVLTGVAFAVATIALCSVPASACSWRGCGGYDYYAPRGYGYCPAPPVYATRPRPAYGYFPLTPVYGYAPPPAYGLLPASSGLQLRAASGLWLLPPAPVYGSGYYRSFYRPPAYGYREVGW